MGTGVKKDRRVLKILVNRNFSFADLDSRFEGVDSSTGNIFCPFHQHTHSSPSAKIYWNEDEEIFVLMCFKEHKSYTAYDYVDKIICEEKGRYKDVLAFLESNMDKDDILTQYKSISKNVGELDSTTIQKKIEYIDNVYNECENTSEYIEKLYTS